VIFSVSGEKKADLNINIKCW